MIAFSMYTNGKKLFRLGNSQQLECLNGIKALSMLWVVLGHVYMAYVFVPLDNYIDVYNVSLVLSTSTILTYLSSGSTRRPVNT
jgi:hypothetical protein